MSSSPFQYAKDLWEHGERLKSLIQFGNNVAPLYSLVHKPEHNQGLCLSGWFDFKAMRSKGILTFWMQHYWVIKEGGRSVCTLGTELSEGTIGWWHPDRFLSGPMIPRASCPTISAGGSFTQFPLIRCVYTPGLMGNPIQPQAWLITKENVLSASLPRLSTWALSKIPWSGWRHRFVGGCQKQSNERVLPGVDRTVVIHIQHTMRLDFLQKERSAHIL